MRLGFVAIARTTFDIPYAESMALTAFEALDGSAHDVIGDAALCTDEAMVRAAVDRCADAGVDRIVLLQATFADSSLAVAASEAGFPLTLWAFSEPRTGGRLRLNSFCGINLAGYALTRLERPYAWVHIQPDDPDVVGHVLRAEDGHRSVRPSDLAVTEAERDVAIHVARRLEETTIGRVGERPDGFEPCGYDAELLRSTVGVVVDEVPLPDLFARSEAASPAEVERARSRSEAFLSGVDEVDQPQLEQSLRMNAGLRSLIEDGRWSGVATRCWPETFTEFGGAACTPMALLTEDGTPGSCEADVYGNVTGLILGWLAGSASFVADLVDIDTASDTGVFWHCGLAPFEMADPAAVPEATIHSNRQMPLLSQFPLKPGRITIARLSQSGGSTRMLIGGGEMLSEPLAFSGTAGVARFDGSAADVIATIMDQGLEHHYGIVYGDVQSELQALADELNIDTVRLAG